MKSSHLLIAISVLYTVNSAAEVTINELSGASPERLLKWSGAGQPSLGPGTAWFEQAFGDAAWSVGASPIGFG
ncbi:MAG: hypothetical protein ACR2RV_14120, partial [Verrucomicrobiales bacterium]